MRRGRPAKFLSESTYDLLVHKERQNDLNFSRICRVEELLAVLRLVWPQSRKYDVLVAITSSWVVIFRFDFPDGTTNVDCDVCHFSVKDVDDDGPPCELFSGHCSVFREADVVADESSSVTESSRGAGFH